MNKQINKQPSVAIIACLKMEELYIKEWLDWHISIGVNHFYLCDNNDKDYEPKLQDVIQDYIDKGIVEVFDYSDVYPIQPICYNDIYNKYGGLYDWWLVIDIDEFIHLPKFNNKIKEYLIIIPNYINKIAINWLFYGDNNLVYYEDKPVQERFINKANTNIIKNGKSQVIKSMIRSNLNIEITNHHQLTTKLEPYDVLFNKINYGYRNLYNYNNDEYNKLINTLHIKHYVTKTIQEYCVNKTTRNLIENPIVNGIKTNYYAFNYFFNFNEKTKEKLDFINDFKNTHKVYNK